MHAQMSNNRGTTVRASSARNEQLRYSSLSRIFKRQKSMDIKVSLLTHTKFSIIGIAIQTAERCAAIYDDNLWYAYGDVWLVPGTKHPMP
jgi:hypothetical protein